MSEPTTKVILWDNDGVLVDTEQLYFESTRQILRSVGIDLTEPQYIELFLKQGKGAWHLAEEQGVPPADIEVLRTRRNELYGRRLLEGPRPIAGITNVLAALHGRYVMGVVTSSRPDHFDLIHRSTNLLQYFDFVLTSGDFTRVKPDPEPYLMAIERSGVAPDACIAVEDSERGLESATRAGVRCIVVPTELTRGGQFAGAYRVLKSARDIPDVL